MMDRTIYTLIVGLVMAGVIHIVIILLVPSYAAKDAWTTLEKSGDTWTFNVVATPNEADSQLPLVDPAFGVAACRFNLSEAPVSVTADGQLPFWSVAIFDRQGRNIYSFNDRTAIERRLNLLVLNDVQIAQFLKQNSDENNRAVVVRSNISEGFVLIRALRPDESWAPALSRFLNNAKCSKFEELNPENNDS